NDVGDANAAGWDAAALPGCTAAASTSRGRLGRNGRPAATVCLTRRTSGGPTACWRTAPGPSSTSARARSSFASALELFEHRAFPDEYLIKRTVLVFLPRHTENVGHFVEEFLVVFAVPRLVEMELLVQIILI